MTRYARQRRIHDCGPVAFLNVLKWLGHKKYRGVPATLDYVKSVYRPLTKYKPPAPKDRWFGGVCREDLLRAAQTIPGTKSYSILFPTWSGVKRHINKGGAVVVLAVTNAKDMLQYPITECKAHYFLITKGSRKKQYSLVNYSPKKTVVSMTSKSIRKARWDNYAAYYVIYIRKAK